MSKPPTIRIDLAARAPVYQQIADELRQHLVGGTLAPGERLPTVRTLAIDLGVHHNTVAQAYRRLADEGWVELARGRGATVRDRRTPASPGRPGRRRFTRELAGLVTRALADGIAPDWLRAELQRRIDALDEGGRG